MTQTFLPVIEVVQRLDTSNFMRARVGLSEVSHLIGNLVGLYSGLQSHYENSDTHTGEQAVFFQAVLTCKHLFVNGVLTLMRGHISESLGYLRKATEFTLFAANVLVKENAAQKWLLASQGTEQWDDYIASFKIHKMTDTRMIHREAYWNAIAEDLPRLNRVIDIYDYCSRRLHASVLAAGPTPHEGGFVFTDSYFDVPLLDASKTTTKEFLYCLAAHVDLLAVHGNVLLLRSGLTFDEVVWNESFQPNATQIQATREQWIAANEPQTGN